MKRGNQNRRARRVRPNTTPNRSRTITGLPIAILCAVFAGAGTAALWAVENGVLTSTSTDPARASTSSSAAGSPVATPPIAGETPRNPGSVAERLRARALSVFRPTVARNHDGHDHDHDSHDHDAHNRDAHGHGAEPLDDVEPSSRRPGFGRQLQASIEEMIPEALRANRVSATPVDTVATDMDLEFWVEWGGGEPRSWFGTLRLDEGTIETARGYGLQADAPGSMYLEDNVVTISPRLPRSFDSVLIRATAPRDANLLVTFGANGSSSGEFDTQIPLMEIVDSTQHRALDDRDNRLIIRRSASDSLRLQTDRTSMVFEPSEMFQFSVLPNVVDFTKLEHRCRVQLRPARSDSNLWVDEREMVQDLDGSISPAGPFKLTMPREEGAYDLIISINKRRSSSVSRAQRGPWRKLQVVVVQSESDGRSSLEGQQAEGPGPQFQVIQEFDPAEPEQPLSVSKVVPLFGLRQTARRPTLHGDVVSVKWLDTDKQIERDLLDIGPDSWFALPLQITQPGHPHILEIDYPNDTPQTLGIAIYEPGSRRAVVDTGLTTSVDNLAERPGVTTYQLTFWPRTDSPILVLADRDSKRAATLGAIRVLAGPDRLRNLENPLPADGRLLAAHLDTPLFPELFSATSDVDQKSGRTLRDWVTFFDGAKRLIQVLKRRGYNGAVIPVLSDGGSLYPSRLLEPTPLFDDGVFFATAQDPMQKDVLEMLLRMFDREGLRLVPSIKFTGTLPILEAKRRLGSRPSINLVDTAGKRWRPQPDSFGIGTHYNPLDQEVQAAMRAVVSELSQRCASHASFAGVAVQLDPGSYATLPGPNWGADEVTIKRFMSAQTGSPSNPLSEHRLRQEWLAWRADRMSEMYHEMIHNLREDVLGAQLYLLGSSLLNTPLVKNAAEVIRAPTEMTASSALLSFGIDVERMREKGIVFLSPRQMKSVPHDQVDLDRAWDDEFVRLFGQHAETAAGSQLQYPFQRFDATTLAGKLPIKDVAKAVKTRIGETGPISRRGLAHGLAALDSQVILDGAWQTPRDEQVWRDSMTVYRQLPEMKFETVSPPVGSKTQPVMIRRAVRGGKALFYVVNDSPRSVGTRIGFAGRHTLELKSLSTTALPRLVVTGQGPMLSLTLRPYEIVGIEASEPNARVVRWETQVDQQVLATLQESLQRLKQCVAAKRDYPQLKNPDFDQLAAQDVIPGWEFGEGAGMQVQVDTHSSHHGRQSLHLQSETPVNWSNGPIVWLRSEWFEPAASGRLVFAGWLKTRDFENQPHVQLLVEGRLPNNQLVRRERALGAVQSDPSARPLGADWNYYTLFVEDLPASVKEVRVGVELRGTGDVWVDQVGVYDLWLNEEERTGLIRDIDIATSMLEEGRVADSEQLLKSHYVQYLFANLPTPAAASIPTPVMATIGDVEPESQEPPSELPRQLGSSQVMAWPDLDQPSENVLRSDDTPRQMRSSYGDSRQLTQATSHDRDWAAAPTRVPSEGANPIANSIAPVVGGTYPVTEGSYPVTDSRDTTSVTTAPPAEAESASWLDKLKNFKFKLPDRRTRPTRQER